METLSNETPKGDSNDLDLMQLAQIVLNWLKKYFWAPLLFLLRFVVRRWYIFLATAVLSVGCTWLYYHYAAVYRGYIVFQNNVWRSSDFILKIQQLNRQNVFDISKSLDLPLEDVCEKHELLAHFVYAGDSLRTAYFIDYGDAYYKPHEFPMYLMTSRFCVEVQAYKRATLLQWQESLRNYLENDPYVANLNRERLDLLKKEREQISQELVLLDSLRRLDYFDAKSASKVASAVVVNEGPARNLYHGEILSLNERLHQIDMVLQDDPGALTLISPMHIDYCPINYWLFYVPDGILYSILLTLLVLLIVEYRKPILAFIKGE
ncbi:MAG: hypothetical protein J6Y77_04655 [Paludibacteraceae bacterium]|nr:hypothetical protein [Paludibacteraceae bacterium]